MFANLESKMCNDYNVLGQFLEQYHSYKSYLEQTTEGESEYYQWRKKVVQGVERLQSELDPDLQKILELRHWKPPHERYTFAEIADELFLTTAQVRRKHIVLLKMFATSIGWVW